MVFGGGKIAKAIVFSENKDVALRISSKAKELKYDVNVLSVNDPSVEDFLSFGADNVFRSITSSDDFETFTSLLEGLYYEIRPDVVLIGSTKTGKEVAARLSQRLNVCCITDALNLWLKDGELYLSKYSLGGKTIAKIRILKLPVILTIAPDSLELIEHKTDGSIIDFQTKLKVSKIKLIEKKKKKRESIDLKDAEVIICVGRGLKRKEDLNLIRELANSLSAEIGCTRPLSHDYGWLPEERMIGLSGEKVRPNLLISIGVSGQIQHVVGIINSKIIVSINKDHDAPIIEHADYAIVGDLYHIVPEILKRIGSDLK